MSLDEFKSDIARRLLHPHAVNSHGYEPVWYLVYDSKRTVEMIGFRQSLANYLETQGLNPVSFSIADALWAIFESDADWEEVKCFDEEELSSEDLLVTLKAMIDTAEGNLLVERPKEALQTASRKFNAVLLVSGFEALHGLLRPGSLEAQLNGAFTCPTVFFYPGRMEGKAGLRFLNFHPVDANYHSEHLEVPEA